MHQTDVAKIGIKFRLVAGTKGIVSAALPVPTRFVVEPAEKAVGVRADVESEGPNTTARANPVGIANAREGVIGMADLKIGLDLPHVLHIVKARTREHGDMSHMRMPAHRPEPTVRIAVHRRRAALVDAVFVHKGRFPPLADDQLVLIKKHICYPPQTSRSSSLLIFKSIITKKQCGVNLLTGNTKKTNFGYLLFCRIAL